MKIYIFSGLGAEILCAVGFGLLMGCVDNNKNVEYHQSYPLTELFERDRQRSKRGRHAQASATRKKK